MSRTVQSELLSGRRALAHVVSHPDRDEPLFKGRMTDGSAPAASRLTRTDVLA
jgi:hypothetical protein